MYIILILMIGMQKRYFCKSVCLSVSQLCQPTVSGGLPNWHTGHVPGAPTSRCKPWIADAKYWLLKDFDATGWPYWHSPVGAVLHRNE